jgi:hypothetical protein
VGWVLCIRARWSGGGMIALRRPRPRYESMARAASARSAAVLNWDVAGRDALARIADLAGVRRERPRRLAMTPY